MNSEGIDMFRRAMKAYKNKERIGMVECELTSISPVTMRITYGANVFDFTKFRSFIDLSGLTREDIGEKYIAQMTEDNQTLIIITKETYDYNDWYIEGGE